ncbi:MAG: hypothetical protein JJU20_07165 [Opitutales bacterium]|nr:hypothetical protein [Opitutales bacterium]
MSYQTTTSNALNRRPLVLGEVLYDHFPDGSKVLGGAPFNVAWNLRGFGLNPLMLSAVGNDASGQEILGRIHAWGMSTSGIECHPQHPTGAVKVSNPSTDPSYDILENRAYDFIHPPAFPIRSEEYGIFYHGSLAYRSPQTRDTILRIREQSGLKVFLDINIRRPWFKKAWLPRLLNGVTWLKLNLDELAALSGSKPDSEAWVHDQSMAVMEHHEIPYLLVTDGSRGAHFVKRSGDHAFAEAGRAEPFIDSVGAGDAFASVCIFGIQHGWDLQTILQRAVGFAAKVCQMQGATTLEKDFYKNDWNSSE